LVEDLVETHRFNPTNPDLQAQYAAPNSSTNPLLTGSPAAQPIVAGGGGLAPTRPGPAAGIRHLLQHKFAWVLIFLLISLFIVGGFTLGRRAVRRRGGPQAELRRPSVEEIVRKSLGFDPDNVSDSDYPGIRGIFIKSLTSDDGPAALAEMQGGDVLMELGDQPVRNSTELSQALDSLKPGVVVAAKLYRDGKVIITRITIADPELVLPPPKVDTREQGFLGIEGYNRRRTATGSWGVELRGVRGNGPSDLAGLVKGDIITEFDGHPVKTAEEFTRRIRATKPRTRVMVKFFRGPAEQSVEMIVGHMD
jgi:membrane-associated protease RseP (regulator of RpoE activity)